MLIINSAGRDTTAQLLSWCIYRLHQHPQVKQRIRQEVREVLGAEFDPMEDVELLDYETVTKRLPYTRAFAMETLRLHPSVPKQAKECAVDHDYLPDGTLVQRGDRVTYVSYAMGRSAQLWDDPDRFDPERFLKDPQPSQYKFIAFNAGPRIWYV
jgi:cytochrome P450